MRPCENCYKTLLYSIFTFTFGPEYFIINYMNNEKDSKKAGAGNSHCENMHKIAATGYLIGNTLHAVLNYLTAIRGYTDMLLNEKNEGINQAKALEAIERLERKCSDALILLSDFCRRSREEFEFIRLHEVIEDALKLTWPLAKYSDITIKKVYEENIPPITAGKEQLMEVFAFIFINSFIAMAEKGALTIKTSYIGNEDILNIVISDTAKGQKDNRPLDLSCACEIIAVHNGSLDVKSIDTKGTTYTINLPAHPTK